MAILAFQKPDKVIMLEGTDTVGRFEFRPLEPGYGQTIGNALRRILLASLEGFAISQIKIGGVESPVMGNGQFIRVIIYLAGSAACLLLAGIINQRKCAALAGHLKTLEAKEAA